MKFQGSKPGEMRWPNRGFLLNSTCHGINSFLMRYMSTVKKPAGAFLSFHFLLFILVISSENSVATDTLTRSQGITVEQTLISAGQIFQLGFFSPGYSGKQYVGIWYKNISGQKPIWVANKEDPLTVADTGSSLTIGNDGNLMLLDGMKKMVWSTNVSSPSNGTIAVLSDKGDLSLKDNVSGLILWESFTYPGDTFIAGMTLGANKRTGEKHVLSSWQKDDDPLPGDFVMGLTTETPPQAFIWRTSKPYWRSGPWDGWKFIGLYSTEKGYSNGLIVTQDNLQGSVDLTYNAHSQSYATQIVLTPEGNLKMSHWHINNSTGGVTWEAIQVPCDVYGTCGPFGVCDRFRSKTCQCLKGFVPKSKEEWSKSNWTGGCVRQTELFCGKNTSTLASDKAKTDEFRKLSAMKLPDHYEYFFNKDALGCQQWCLSNCSCVAYAYVDGIGCMVWASDLLDVQQFLSTGADLFLRLAYSELGGNKKMIEVIIIITAVPGAIFLVAFLYGLSKWIANRRETRRHQIKGVDFADRVDTPRGSPRGNMQGHCIIQTKSSDLPMFDFNSLAVATNNFSETNKLGAGGFGPVYKGKLEDGQEIAVKRLSNHSGQGDVEFKNEILLISKLQHRNLVRLLGYCIEGDEMLLIYEYLKNKSLDTFLFDAKKRLQLDWNKRFNIIEGIARGLLYLHRDSCLRIIHRDLKASNILLDDNMNPKISDFGIARTFQITQELANTCRIVGTFGYMSPEYAIGGLFSEKSDVFSFGVLLLEIISGTKITGSGYQEECLNLQEHAWHLWKEGRGLDLMDMELSDSCSQTDFMKCMQIGLLCVQDHAERPTMSVVVLMLTSDRDIPQPKQPTLYKGLQNLDLQLQLNNVLSRNDTSLSMVEGHG